MREKILQNEQTAVPFDYVNKNNQGTIAAELHTTEYEWIREVRHDVVTPRFKERIAAGEIINSPMDYLLQSVSYPGRTASGSDAYGNFWFMNGAGYNYASSIWPVPSYHDLPVEYRGQVVDAINTLKQGLLGRIDNGAYSFGEDVAELKKTLESLSKIFVEIKRILFRLDAAVAAAIKAGKSPRVAFSQLWLRARYEIRPLIYSAQDLIEIYNHGVDVKQRRKTTHVEHLNWILNKQYQTGTTTKFFWEQVSTYRVKLSGGILYLDSGLPHGLLDELGLGTKDILPTVWAITRFSFLIDRFLNLSSMIRGIQNVADPNIKFLAGWLTTTGEYQDFRRLTGITKPGWAYNSDLSVKSYYLQKIRSPWSPSLADTLPVFTLDVSVETLTDLATIFLGRKGKTYNALKKKDVIKFNLNDL